MVYVWLIAGALLLVVTVMVALGRGDSEAAPAGDRRQVVLPTDRPLNADDIDQLRLPQGVRGYRMAETDDLLDRIAKEVRTRDERISELEEQVDRGFYQR